jgi:hypothetical protein
MTALSLRAAGAVALILALPGGSALAQNEPVRFFNRSTQSATALHVVRSGQTAWSGNLLSRGTLAPGQFISVRLGDGAGCRIDVRLSLADGTVLQRQGADVCATRAVDLAPDAVQPPAADPPPGAPAAQP